MSDSFRLSVSPGAALFYPLLLLSAEDWELCALLGGILVHEAGHALALLCLGGRVRGLALELSGLRMEAVLPPSPGREALCALADPAAGLVWSGIAARIGGERPLCASGLHALLSLFNLLPCLPLDGGRAILALSGKTGFLRGQEFSVRGGCFGQRAAAAFSYAPARSVAAEPTVLPGAQRRDSLRAEMAFLSSREIGICETPTMTAHFSCVSLTKRKRRRVSYHAAPFYVFPFEKAVGIRSFHRIIPHSDHPFPLNFQRDRVKSEDPHRIHGV